MKALLLLFYQKTLEVFLHIVGWAALFVIVYYLSLLSGG
jgi:hypothetical protein